MISIKNLTYYIDDKLIIDNLSLDIDKKVTVIVGRSGCGKTQLLKQILTRNDAVKSNNINYGYMPQDLLLFKWYNVLENLEIANIFDNSIEQLLTDFSLTQFKDSYISELSGGQQSRIAFLRAYLMSEQYLILDEPFSKLDYLTHEEVMNWLKHMIDKLDKSIILVTHNLDEALLLADEIIVLGQHAKYLESFKKPFSSETKKLIIDKLVLKDF